MTTEQKFKLIKDSLYKAKMFASLEDVDNMKRMFMTLKSKKLTLGEVTYLNTLYKASLKKRAEDQIDFIERIE